MKRRLILAPIGAALALAAPSPALGAGAIHADRHSGGVKARDARAAAAPRTESRRAVERLGARATWNRFGTPRTLIRDDGRLATDLEGDAVAVARAFLRRNAGLYGLDAAAVGELEVVNDARLAGSGMHAVLLAQRAGGLPAIAGGSVIVGVMGDKVTWASADMGPSRGLAGEQRLTAQEGWLRAARAVGRAASAERIGRLGHRNGFNTLEVHGLGAQQVRLAALPRPDGPARRVWEANVLDDGPESFGATVFVDAETGEALRVGDRVDQIADEPRWQYFPNVPPIDGADTDRRIIGCFPGGTSPQAGCHFDERTTPAAAPQPWDQVGGAPLPSFTTLGNNADTALSAANPLAPGPDRGVRPTSSTRDYLAPFTDSWRNSTCNPAVFAGGIVPATGPNTFGGTNANDVNASIINLFAQHNNMHDWSYELGFTEQNYNLQVNNFGRGGLGGDPELGDAQAGALSGGAPTYQGRDNANQRTTQDGTPGNITNMYLWQPIASAFYPPCVDGDFDMSVVAHEYTHAISNRMVGGPNNNLTSSSDGQARAMGESWSDLAAIEYLAEHGYAPADDENPFAVGAYVTGSKQKGIRNYGMNDSPLNYSDVQGYDGSGSASPHDDGEIWSAANFDIREAFIAKYGEGSAATQLACARGSEPAGGCPGNRRWMQMVFDAFLLMPPDGEVSMLEARDAYLAAAPADHAELWTAFARRGFGHKASSGNPSETGDFGDTDDPDPVSSFESPLRTDEAQVRFQPRDEAGRTVKAELFVGDYEANVTPVADTDPATPLGDTVAMVPGEYAFVARGDGRGTHRLTRALAAGAAVDLAVAMPLNRASRHNGAAITGEGVNREDLIDDTEETNWAVLDREPDVRGADVTVRLAGGEQIVERVNVSALLHAPDEGDSGDDPGSQNRFTALRQFELWACRSDCNGEAGFTKFFTSADDAFPGGVPRPVAPDMSLRSFDVPDTQATHLRLVVADNQCTGSALYTNNALDNDPASNSDCRLGNPPLILPTDGTVRAAELQVFSRDLAATGGDDGGTPLNGTPPPAPAPSTVPPATVCASTAGFRSVGARPRRRGLRIRMQRRVASPVNVDVFQQARGRRVIDNLLVARFTRRTRSFTWNGRPRNAKRLTDGRFFVRFRMPTGAGRRDVRRVTLARSGGRFRSRPPFYGRNSCGLLTSYKLSSAVFGGLQGRRLGIAFRVSARARVGVVVRRGSRVVRRYRTRAYRGRRTHRLVLSSRGLRRGDYRVTLRAVRGRRRAGETLVARRL